MSGGGQQRSILSFMGHGQAVKSGVQKKGGHKETSVPSKQIQLHLDLGQRSFSPRTCPTCGMLYSKGNAEDEKAHHDFHAGYGSITGGFPFQGWAQERVIANLGSLGRIINVQPSDSSAHVRRILDICSHLEQNMGFASGWLLPSFRTGQGLASPLQALQQHVFLHVSPAEKCINGILILEPLKPAVKGPSRGPKRTLEGSESAAGREEDLGQAYIEVPFSSKRALAICGVRMIWVSHKHKRRGIATRLIDIARCNWIHGFVVDRNKFAFAHLTKEGSAFAARYCAGIVTEYEAT